MGSAKRRAKRKRYRVRVRRKDGTAPLARVPIPIFSSQYDMRKHRKRKRKRTQNGTEQITEPESLAAFVEHANEKAKGRSPAVLPLAEELLLRKLVSGAPGLRTITYPADFAPAPEPKLCGPGPNSAFGIKPLPPQDLPAATPLPCRQAPLWRSVWLLPLAIAIGLAALYQQVTSIRPLVQAPPVAQMKPPKMTTAQLLAILQDNKSNQSNQSDHSNGPFLRALKAADKSIQMGDLGEAVTCCGIAAMLPHDRALDHQNLLARIVEISKKRPADPDVSIAMGRALQANSQLKEAANQYRRARKLSPGRKNAVAEQLLQEIDLSP